MGLTTLNQTPKYYGPSLGLGGRSSSFGYGCRLFCFCNEGYKVPPVSILK